MIRFRTTFERDDQVHAWNLSVVAIYLHGDQEPYGEAFNEAFLKAEEGSATERGHGGLVIAELEAMIINVGFVMDEDEAVMMIDRHMGVGGTLDICANAYQTGESFVSWLGAGGAREMFEADDQPISKVIITRYLQTDPFVDRGAVLAHMIPHIAAFTSDRIIIAHQENSNDHVPDDQKGRVMERISALSGIGARIGFDLVGHDAGAQRAGAEMAYVENDLGEEIVAPGQLPLMIISVPEPHFPESCYEVWDDVEIFDVGDWAREVLGVEIVMGDGPEP